MLFTGGLKGLLYGENAGLKKSEVEKMSKHSPFSDYLNYGAYDPETKVYLNQDNTIGFLWECSPLVFAGQKAMTTLDGLFRCGLPDNAVLQFILYADPYIDPVLEASEAIRTRSNPLIDHYKKNLSDFVKKAKAGCPQLANIPVRNFRLFVSLKFPDSSREAIGNGWSDLRGQIEETLSGVGLAPRPMEVEDLLEWGRRFFNDDPPSNCSSYNEEMPIRKQIIVADTEVRDGKDHMRVGRKDFRCITPKSMPKEVDFFQTNELFGGVMGMVSDADQIKTPFLYCLNIVFSPLKKKVHAKCNFVLQQEAVGSFAPSLKRKQAEYLRASDDVERGVPFVRVMPVMWVWSDSEKESIDSATRVRRMWESRGFVMQNDRGILKILFLASLPFGLYLAGGKTLDNLERDFIADSNAVIPTLPIQADFAGAGLPKVILYGRKGQICTLDFWAKGSINQNSLIFSSTGGGKSFLANQLLFGYYSSGAKIRVLDIGRSYKKLVNLLDARWIDIGDNYRGSLNPFTNILNPKEDLKSVVSMIAQMAYADMPGQSPDNIEMNLIRNAVRWAWKVEGNEASTDLIWEFLAKYPENKIENEGDLNAEMAGNQVKTDKIIEKSRHLAYQIQEFTSKGSYGEFFKGPSEFDIRSDDAVILELASLRGIPELYRVVTMLVMNAIIQDVYDPKQLEVPKFVLFDEAHQYMTAGSAQLADMIEYLYRTCRKANAGVSIVSQSVLDIKRFGTAGEVVWGNSAYKILLESSDYPQAKREGLLDYDDFTMELLRSVKSNPPKYSEMFLDTPFGRGVARLSVDDYAYYICTSKGSEIAEIESMVANGKSYHEAIEAMVKKYHS